MKPICLCLFLFIITLSGHILANGDTDTLTINKLNKQAYDYRMTNPEEMVKQAKKTLVLAHKIDYANGEAEANRVIGIGYDYLTLPDTALNYYLKALAMFQANNNQLGQAKVNNNIGNLYQQSDYEKSIEYFNTALAMAQKLDNEELIAKISMNFGNIYYRKKEFSKGLAFFTKSRDLFTKLGDATSVILCQQNIGVIYYNLNQYDVAEKLLVDANEKAKAKDLNAAVASIDLTLIPLYEKKGRYDKAEFYLTEGLAYAKLVKSHKFEYDYKLTKYELEFERKDYKAALFSLRDIYRLDSAAYKNNVSLSLNQLQQQYKQAEQDHKNELLLADKNKQQILFWSTILVVGLLLIVVFLLVSNVNRKAKTNQHLTELNLKITEQKENLNQINHHLEEIIDERTKDLQVKNKKLADYSLHLSHQIRGPIATLKGLLNLEKDKLIEEKECIKLMNKCVSEIDDNIIDMSGMLHESNKTKI